MSVWNKATTWVKLINLSVCWHLCTDFKYLNSWNNQSNVKSNVTLAVHVHQCSSAKRQDSVAFDWAF